MWIYSLCIGHRLPRYITKVCSDICSLFVLPVSHISTAGFLQPEEFPTIVDTWVSMQKLLGTGKPTLLRFWRVLSPTKGCLRQGQVHRSVQFLSQDPHHTSHL